ALRAALQQAVHDQALVEAGGRWQPGQPDPAELVPGALFAVAACATAPTNRGRGGARPPVLPAGRRGGRDHGQPSTPRRPARRPAAAVRHGHGLLRRGPDHPPQLQRWSPALDDPDRGLPAVLAAEFLGLPPLDRARADLVWAARELGGYLSGVTLFAGAGGRGVADDVLWL